MTDTDLDARIASHVAAIHAMATTARRSLGQRFRKIERDLKIRDAVAARAVNRYRMLRLSGQIEDYQQYGRSL